MTLLDIGAGLLFGALAGMGIGGGGLIVIYLCAFRSFSQIDAQGTNLLFFAVAAAASMAVHFRKRRIDVRTVVCMALAGIAGSFFGSRVAAAIPQEITRKLFGFMLTASGLITLYKSKSKKRKTNAE